MSRSSTMSSVPTLCSAPVGNTDSAEPRGATATTLKELMRGP